MHCAETVADSASVDANVISLRSHGVRLGSFDRSVEVIVSGFGFGVRSTTAESGPPPVGAHLKRETTGLSFRPVLNKVHC